MRVYQGPYKNWFGPYQLANKLIWWQNKYDDNCRWAALADRLGDWLAHGWQVPKYDAERPFSNKDEHKTWLYKLMLWWEAKRPPRKIKVQIDPWDVWGLDSTLAEVILPALIKLKETKHGYPHVDLEDVPYHLQAVEQPEWSPQRDLFEDVEKINPEHISIEEERWAWVLDEMIWAFSQINTDWASQYDTGNIDFVSKPVMHNGQKMYELVHGPNHTFQTDMEGRERHQARINRGLKLFGKYYQNLWD